MTVANPIHTSTPSKQSQNATSVVTSKIARQITPEESEENSQSNSESRAVQENNPGQTDGESNSDAMDENHLLECQRPTKPPTRPETEGMDSSELSRITTTTTNSASTTLAEDDDDGVSLQVHPGSDTTRAALDGTTQSVLASVGSEANTTSNISNITTASSAAETPGAPKGDLENLLSYQPSQR